MSIYVDGTERASGTAPANFGPVRYSPTNVLRAGHLDLDGPSDNTVWEPEPEMYGFMDELRILNYALTPTQVMNTWLGLPTQSGALLKGLAPASKSAAAATTTAT